MTIGRLPPKNSRQFGRGIVVFSPSAEWLSKTEGVAVTRVGQYFARRPGERRVVDGDEGVEVDAEPILVLPPAGIHRSDEFLVVQPMKVKTGW